MRAGANSRKKRCDESLTHRKETGCEVCVSIQVNRTRVTEVLIKEGESFDQALKKFTRKVQQDGLLSEAKRRQHYEPPSVKRKRKAEARARKARKARLKAAAKGY